MRYALAALTALIAAPAAAQERDLCPDRPGLGSPPCTVAPGKVLVETALGDWTREDDGATRTDTILVGDTLLRLGLTNDTELLIGWTPYGHQRVRDALTDRVASRGRIGDVTLGAKLNLANPDGSGFSVALQPSVTLPVGRSPIGAGDWGATLIAPIAYDLGGGVSLQATPEVDAAVDEDGDGRHFAYGSVVGVGVSLSDAVTAAIEVQLIRDDDPAGRTTQALGGVALAWQPDDDLQLDLGTAIGLNRDSPDVELYAGIARRF